MVAYPVCFQKNEGVFGHPLKVIVSQARMAVQCTHNASTQWRNIPIGKFLDVETPYISRHTRPITHGWPCAMGVQKLGVFEHPFKIIVSQARHAL